MLSLALDLFRHSYNREHSNNFDRHKDIIKKLKFIAKIEGGERINVATVSTMPNNLYTSTYRTFYKESRMKTFQFLNDVIDRSFELIILHKDSAKVSDRITCSQIVEDLHLSVIGLTNLKVTYGDDRNFACDIDTLIGSIFARLAELYQQQNILIPEDTRQRMFGTTHLHPYLKSLFPDEAASMAATRSEPPVIPITVASNAATVPETVIVTKVKKAPHKDLDA